MAGAAAVWGLAGCQQVQPPAAGVREAAASDPSPDRDERSTASMRGVSVVAPWLEPEGGGVDDSCSGGKGLTEVWDPDAGAYPGDPCGVTSPEVDCSPALILTARGLMLPAPQGGDEITVDGRPAVRTDRVDPATGEVYLVSVVVPANGVEMLIRPDQTEVERVLAATRVDPRPPDPAEAPVRAVPVPGGATLLVSTAERSVVAAGTGFPPGRLSVLVDGCVGTESWLPGDLVGGVDAAQVRPGDLLVWPSSTTALPDGSGVDVPGAGVLRFGDEVSVEASTRYLAALDPASTALDEVPPARLPGRARPPRLRGPVGRPLTGERSPWWARRLTAGDVIEREHPDLRPPARSRRPARRGAARHRRGHLVAPAPLRLTRWVRARRLPGPCGRPSTD